MSESVEIILSAEDNATVVMQQAAEEAQKLNQSIQDISKSSASTSGAVAKLANTLGAGWIADSARQVKDLSESVKGAAGALRGGGVSALAMKAGLIGLAAVGVYKAFAYAASSAEEELSKLADAQKRMNDEIAGNLSTRMKQQFADLKEFGGEYEKQKEESQKMVEQINKEIAGIEARKKAKEKEKADLAGWTTGPIFGSAEQQQAAQNEIDLANRQLEILKEQRKEQTLYFSEAEEERRRKREQIDAEKEAQRELEAANKKRQEDVKKQEADILQQQQQLQDEILKMQVSELEFDLIKLERQEDLTAKERERLQLLIEQKHALIEQKKEADELAKRQAEFEKDKLREEEKAISDVEREIEKLQNTKIDDISDRKIAGEDTRLLSRGGDAVNVQQQMLAEQKRQSQIADKQRELNERMESHLRRIADNNKNKPDILELVVGG